MSKMYRNCSEIFVYNFYKVLETQNLSWLVLDYDGYNEVKFDEKEAEKVWIDIYEDYFRLIQDNKTLIIIETTQELMYLRARKEYAELMIFQLDKINENERLECIKELREWNYKVNDKIPLDELIDSLNRQVLASENKINIKEQELKDLTKENGEKISLIQQTIKLELALGKNEIDTKRTTMEKFIGMIDEVKLIVQERKKRNGK